MRFTIYMTITLAPEIYTEKFEETLEFYGYLGFEPKDDALGFIRMDGFAPLALKDNPACILYVCEAHSPAVDALFHPSFRGEGLIFQIITSDVDSLHAAMRRQGIPIALALTNDGSNGRHFAVRDPNGIVIDITEFTDNGDN